METKAEEETTKETPATEENTVELQQRLRLKQNLKVELCSRDLWRKFHTLGTEMIITKAGRRMFPTVKVRLTGLDPAASYIVFLDIVPVDDKRYRYVYHSSQWMVAGSGDPPLPHNLYVHPDSPATGQLWMAQGVVAFDKLKLTNNRKPLVRGQISLHSMHKYLPRVHILQTTDLDTPPEQQARVEHALTYTFPETTFTTVTAYQNQQITRLKIASNPFAKGFREASRTRDSLDDTRHPRSHEYPSPPLIGQPKFSPADIFGLHPDFSFLPSSPLFLAGRSPLESCCHASSVTGNFFHTAPNPYGCHPLPPSPLTMPVKFIVPPSSGGIVSDCGRKTFEENSSLGRCTESLKHFVSPEPLKKLSLDNYSRLALRDSDIRKQSSESMQNGYTSSLSDIFLNKYDHHPRHVEDRQSRTEVSKITTKTSAEEVSRTLTSSEQLRSSSEDLILHTETEVQNVCDLRSNFQMLDETKQCLEKSEINELKPVTNCKKDSTSRKGTISSPLDLTKLK